MNLVRLLSLLLYTFGVFTFGALFILWLRGVVRRQAWRGSGSEPVGRVNPLEGAFSFVTFVWFAVNLLSTLSSVSPNLALAPIDRAILPIAFLFPPLYNGDIRTQPGLVPLLREMMQVRGLPVEGPRSDSHCNARQ